MSYTDDKLNTLYADQFVAFKSIYRDEAEMKTIVESFRRDTSFETAWRPFVVDRFPLLVDFLNGFASVFSGTSTVKSAFSLIGIEKDCYIESLTDFSLEGLMKC